MNPKRLIDVLVEGGASVQDIADHLTVIEKLLNRSSNLEQILSLIDAIQLKEFPRLRELVLVLNSAALLTESGKNALIRECMSRNSDLIVMTSDAGMVESIDAQHIVVGNTIGLEAHQGQRIYKRSLDTDVSKLLK